MRAPDASAAAQRQQALGGNKNSLIALSQVSKPADNGKKFYHKCFQS
jgi:hypothetical protein